MFDPATARGLKGLGPDAAGRFAARAEFLAGARPHALARPGAAREVGAVYGDLARATRAEAPGALLAVATPGAGRRPGAGQEARRADGLGLAPGLAWRALGLDLKAWPDEAGGPVVLRGVALADDELGRDLATSPDLDEQVAARPSRGLLLSDPADDAEGRGPTGTSRCRWPRLPPRGPGGRRAARARPGGAGRPLVLISAVGVAGPGGAFAPLRPRLPRPARARRRLAESGGRLPSGVAVRSATAGGKIVPVRRQRRPLSRPCWRSSSTPRPNATVDDLGRGLRLAPEPVPGGGRQLVLELAPFGSAAIRVGAPGARELAR